jgi:RNA polymerase sigma factor (sigma-70 family)
MREPLDLVGEYKKTGDIKLRDKILEENLEFIKKQVGYLCFDSRYRKDFEQEGVIGFLEALERFKVGGSFKTCAFWGIKKRILEYYRNIKSAVKTTHRYNILLGAARKRKVAMEKENSEVTEDAFTDTLSRRERHVWDLHHADSCDLEYVENTEVFSTNDAEKREREEEENINKKFLAEILNELEEHERWLISTRYGIGTQKQSLAEIGFYLGKTPQRVEQMQRKVERKIRKRLNFRNARITVGCI